MIEEYKEIIKIVEDILLTNTEWINRYNNYAVDISEIRKKYETDKKSKPNYKLRIPKSLVACTSLTNNDYTCDLRYNGDKIATLTINKKTNKKELKLNLLSSAAKKYFKDFSVFKDKVDWNSEEALKFRKYFENIDAVEKKRTWCRNIFKTSVFQK